MDKTILKIKRINKKPLFARGVYTASGAKIIGNVSIDKDSSIWYNTVIRGDINKVTIGKRTNIQDNSVIHVENDEETIIGDDVTTGHNCILHGCKIGNGVLIGMGAIIMSGADIGDGSIIGAGTLIKENSHIPMYSTVVGVPGKIIKTNEKENLERNIMWAKKYVKLAKVHQEL
jgi:carbonic anhydrase/acetyltransferase-like protein (isoleucine patch superfamily)